MKKSLFGILVAATVLTPAAAMAQEHHEGGRSASRPAPQPRAAPQARVAPQTRAEPMAASRAEVPVARSGVPMQRGGEVRGGGEAYRNGGAYRGGDVRGGGNYLRRPPEGGAWSRGWRQDRRYDWAGYRNYNRGLFHLRPYAVPYGWGYGYRRFSVGMTLMSMLFAQNYWISDPYYYRLPPVYGPYRWVRYYNDALLIDVRTGMVVDTAYNIFW